MRVTYLRLENVYGFRDITLSFPVAAQAVLVGVNGAGKSTVLDTIAAFLERLSLLLRGRELTRSRYGITQNAIHVDATHAQAELGFEADGETGTWRITIARAYPKPLVESGMARWADQAHKRLAEEQGRSVPVLCYYPAVRFYLYESFQTRRVKVAPPAFPQLSAYDNAFEMGQHSFENVVTWFRMEEDLENEIRLAGEPEHRSPRLEAVRRAVARFLGALSSNTYSELRIRRGRLDTTRAALVVTKDGLEIPLYSLSDGERGAIVLVADLAQRLSAANPGAKDPLSGSGVVLIDEIELHLHPAWQREILPALGATFPGCQIIATTHSPQVLSRVPRESVLLLSRFQVVKKVPFTEGRDSNAILSELMGVPERPVDATRALRKLARAIDEEDIPRAKKELAALEKRLGPDEHELLRLGAMLRVLEPSP